MRFMKILFFQEIKIMFLATSFEFCVYVHVRTKCEYYYMGCSTSTRCRFFLQHCLSPNLGSVWLIKQRGGSGVCIFV